MLRKLVNPMTVCTLVLLCIISSSRLFAQKPAVEKPQVKQTIVYLQQDGGSHLMVGDVMEGVVIQNTNAVLPAFLAQGWRIAHIDMTGSAGVQPEQIIGIVLLEKDR